MSFGPYTVREHKKFKGVIVNASFDDFIKYGFEFGDSIDVTFSNGQRLIDVPFYNGFYVKTHNQLICDHPGYKEVYVCYSDGPGMFKALNLNTECTATFDLNTKGKYLDVQNSMQQDYSYSRQDYISDEVFANFRQMNYGKLIPNLFYRSSSPIVDSEKRASYADDLCKKSGINFIIDLSIDEKELNDKYKNSERPNAYWRKLYSNKSILPLNLSSLFEDEDYRKSLVLGLKAIINNEGPFLINCSLGKDRTGFFCMVLEALGKASVQEVEEDFMKSFSTLHFVDSSNPRYKVIKEIRFGNYACFLANVNNVEEITNDNLFNGVKAYLSSSGMTNEEIDLLINKISLK